MTLYVPPQPPDPFNLIDGNALELILSGRPFTPDKHTATTYRIKERLRGSASRVNYGAEHLIAIRTFKGTPKLGVYRYDGRGEQPAELLVSFRLERVR